MEGRCLPQPPEDSEIPVFADQLFCALLAPQVCSPVRLPRRFALSYRDALLCSIEPRYLDPRFFETHPWVYLDPQCITGRIEHPGLRSSVERVLDELPEVERVPDMYFRECHAGLRLRLIDYARLEDHRLSAIPEYRGLRQAFPAWFAYRCNPADPQAALSDLAVRAPRR